MATEIEVKFLDINIDDVRARLKAAGGKLEYPMRLMRRDQFDHADNRYTAGNRSERLRIRDEGNKLTMTYKSTTGSSDYADELEITIDSYDEAKKLLTAVGLHSFAYQESKRETWLLNGAEVVIDVWPWTKPYIEIEGPTEANIKSIAATLGFNWEDAGYGSVDTVYMAEYPKMTDTDTIGEVAEVRFDLPMPDYLKDRL